MTSWPRFEAASRLCIRVLHQCVRRVEVGGRVNVVLQRIEYPDLRLIARGICTIECCESLSFVDQSPLPGCVEVGLL